MTVDGLPARENDGAQAKLYLMSEEKSLSGDDAGEGCIPLEQSLSIRAFRRRRPFALAQQFRVGYSEEGRHPFHWIQIDFKIILALSLDVPYLLFDEPVLGLDANHRGVIL